jgi:hypothetical protein
MTPELLERGISELRIVWDNHALDYLPGRYQFKIWLERYGYEVAVFGIERTIIAAETRAKRGQPAMDADHLLRYASACMRNKLEEIEENAARAAGYGVQP